MSHIEDFTGTVYFGLWLAVDKAMPPFSVSRKHSTEKLGVPIVHAYNHRTQENGGPEVRLDYTARQEALKSICPFR